MPIFSYKCEECGNIFDMLVFAGEKDEDMECPACGAKKAKKQVSPFSSSGGSCASTGGFT
ncbi:MAG TPA: zinc ribbon domain-containing protein [bacterium]|nr:zinc ribbon domain-containing protein [bacterium]